MKDYSLEDLGLSTDLLDSLGPKKQSPGSMPAKRQGSLSLEDLGLSTDVLDKLGPAREKPAQATAPVSAPAPAPTSLPAPSERYRIDVVRPQNVGGDKAVYNNQPIKIDRARNVAVRPKTYTEATVQQTGPQGQFEETLRLPPENMPPIVTVRDKEYGLAAQKQLNLEPEAITAYTPEEQKKFLPKRLDNNASIYGTTKMSEAPQPEKWVAEQQGIAGGLMVRAAENLEQTANAGDPDKIELGRQLSEAYGITPDEIKKGVYGGALGSKVTNKFVANYIKETGNAPKQEQIEAFSAFGISLAEGKKKELAQAEKAFGEKQVEESFKTYEAWLRQAKVDEKVSELEKLSPGIERAYKRGDLGFVLNVAMGDAMLTGNKELINRINETTNAFKEVYAAQDTEEKKAGVLVYYGAKTIEILGPMAKSVALEAPAMAIPGVGGARIARRITKGIGSAASMAMWVKQGSGDIYKTLIDEGVPHDIAMPAALGGAIPYAFTEKAQIGQVIDPGVRRILSQSYARYLAKKALEKGADWGKESAEEGIQEWITTGSVINALKAAGMDDKAAELEIKQFKKGIDAAIQGGITFAPLNLIGFARGMINYSPNEVKGVSEQDPGEDYRRGLAANQLRKLDQGSSTPEPAPSQMGENIAQAPIVAATAPTQMGESTAQTPTTPTPTPAPAPAPIAAAPMPTPAAPTPTAPAPTPAPAPTAPENTQPAQGVHTTQDVQQKSQSEEAVTPAPAPAAVTPTEGTPVTAPQAPSSARPAEVTDDDKTEAENSIDKGFIHLSKVKQGSTTYYSLNNGAGNEKLYPLNSGVIEYFKYANPESLQFQSAEEISRGAELTESQKKPVDNLIKAGFKYAKIVTKQIASPNQKTAASPKNKIQTWQIYNDLGQVRYLPLAQQKIVDYFKGQVKGKETPEQKTSTGEMKTAEIKVSKAGVEAAPISGEEKFKRGDRVKFGRYAGEVTGNEKNTFDGSPLVRVLLDEGGKKTLITVTPDKISKIFEQKRFIQTNDTDGHGFYTVFDTEKGKVVFRGTTRQRAIDAAEDLNAGRKIREREEEAQEPAAPESVKARARKAFQEKQRKRLERDGAAPGSPVAEIEKKRDAALDRAKDALKKLGESFSERDPNTFYMAGTEQAELAFEVISALVDAGYYEFKAIALKVAEMAKDFLNKRGFMEAIEDAYDAYAETDEKVRKRESGETFASILDVEAAKVEKKDQESKKAEDAERPEEKEEQKTGEDLAPVNDPDSAPSTTTADLPQWMTDENYRREHYKETYPEAKRISDNLDRTIEINTPDRKKRREDIANEYYGTGSKVKGREAALIIGLPAAGKSRFADEIVEKNGSIILDNDMIKKKLPEYQNGLYATAVHEESSLILDEMVLPRCVKNGDNFILPCIGKTLSTLRARVKMLREKNYSVKIVFVNASVAAVRERLYKRFIKEMRIIDDTNLDEKALLIAKNYSIIKVEEEVDYEERDGQTGRILDGKTESKTLENAPLGDRKNDSSARPEHDQQSAEGLQGALPEGISGGDRQNGRELLAGREGESVSDRERGSSGQDLRGDTGRARGQDRLRDLVGTPEATPSEDAEAKPKPQGSDNAERTPDRAGMERRLPGDVRESQESRESEANAPRSAGEIGTGVLESDRRRNDLSGSEGAGLAGVLPAERSDERTQSENNARDTAPRDYVITDADNLGSGGLKAKFRDNINTIKTLKKIEKEGRLATPEEQAILVKYVGWGALKQVFVKEDDVDPKWAKEAKELRSLLTEEELNAASASQLNAHFSAATVIRGMWNAITRMGFAGGKVYEPAIGVGHFFGLRPSGFQYSMVGVDLDKISGRIAKNLYQTADIRIQGYETVPLLENHYDLFISNVPFFEGKPYDKDSKNYGIKPRSLALHDFYFVKSLYATRPGGMVAFITSRYTMDKIDSTVRRKIAESADFVGAIRLPNTAFKGNAGTEVVTDIIFLQKREQGKDMSELTRDFISLGDLTLKTEKGEKSTVKINKYYLQHPKMVIGKQSLEGSMYSENEYTVYMGAEKIGGAMDEALKNLPANIMLPVAQNEKRMLEDMGNALAPRLVPVGSFFMVNGKLYTKINAAGKALPAEMDERDIPRTRALITFKNIFKTVFQNQLKSQSPNQKDLQRLNNVYDAFVKRYGYLHDPKTKNIVIIDRDGDLSGLLALEKWDSESKTATKSSFLKGKLAVEREAAIKIETAEDAYLASLAKTGTANWEYMAKESGKDIAELQKDLLDKKIFFLDHESKQSGQEIFIPREEYLSGDVRKKLREAQELAKSDDRYLKNVESLLEVQPPIKGPGQIDILINSPIIDVKDIADFANARFSAYEGSKSVWVHHDSLTGKYSVEVKDKRSSNNVDKWGVNFSPEVAGYEGVLAWSGTNILETVLNNGQLTVRMNQGTSKDPNWVVDEKATVVLREKAEQLKDDFKRWVWRDPERAKRIVERFNNEFNNLAERKYIHPMRVKNPDAKVKLFGGTFELRANQADAIWRVLQSQNTMLAHGVGAGKTAIISAASMEMRRLGIRKKNLIVVPNHMIPQWQTEILTQYPGARVLAATSTNFSDQTARREFLNKAAIGDYDIVLMRYSHYKMISLSPEIQSEFLQERKAQYQDALERVKAEEAAKEKDDRKKRRMKTRAQKSIEKALLKMEARQEQLMDMKRDSGFPYFDEMGFDQIFVDEADNFKNLDFASSIQNILGMGQQQGSEQALDMHMKVQFLQRQGGGVVFATGTPISNSLAEAYHMMRFLQPQDLTARNLGCFDEWQRMFAEPVTQWELNASGTGLKQRTRFSKFYNVQELARILRKTWDVMTSQMLEERGILRRGHELPLVKREIIESNVTPILTEYLDHLGEREREIELRKGPPEKGQDIHLVVIGHGKLASIDTRLIHPSLPDEPGSKLNRVIERAYALYNENPETAGVIFYDLTRPRAKGEKMFDVYAEIKAKLVEMGVPAKEIAFIHDFDNDAKKLQLFADVNAAKVRILIGSTPKLGAGTNIQHKLKWLIHIDGPNRPRDVIQREGRIIRQGNENKEVVVATAISKGSHDQSVWEMLTRKARMIDDVISGENTDLNEIDEEDPFAEASIAAIGTPLMKQRAETKSEVKRLNALIENKQNEQYVAQDKIELNNQLIGEYEEKISEREDVVKAAGEKPEQGKTKIIGPEGKEITKREAANKEIVKWYEENKNFAWYRYKNAFKIGAIDVALQSGRDDHIGIELSAGDKLVTIDGPGKPVLVLSAVEEFLFQKQGDIPWLKKRIATLKKENKEHQEVLKEDTAELGKELDKQKTRLKQIESDIAEEAKKKAEEKAGRERSGYDFYELEEQRRGLANEENDKEEGEEEAEIEVQAPKTEVSVAPFKVEKRTQLMKDGDEIELAYPDAYYVLIGGEGFLKQPTAKAVKLEADPTGDWFIYKTKQKQWAVIEGRTGLGISAINSTMEGAISMANDILRPKKEQLEPIMGSNIRGESASMAGLSPRYRIKGAAPAMLRSLSEDEATEYALSEDHVIRQDGAYWIENPATDEILGPFASRKEANEEIENYNEGLLSGEIVPRGIEPKESPELSKAQEKRISDLTTAAMGKLEDILSKLPKGTGERLEVEITDSFDVRGRRFGTEGGWEAAVWYNPESKAIELYINPGIKINRIATALNHELPGHIGSRLVYASNPEIYKKMRAFFDQQKAANDPTIEKIRRRYRAELESSPARADDVLFDEWTAANLQRYLDGARDNIATRIYGYFRGILIKLHLAKEKIDDVLRVMVREMRTANLEGLGAPAQAFLKDEANFGQQIDDFLAGKLGRNDVIKVGNTPDVLKMIGAPALPIEISTGVLNKSMNEKHQIAVQEMKRLPDAIADPIAIFESATNPNSLVIMTEMKEGNKTVVVVLELEKSKGRGITINDIRSVYGKDSPWNFFDWMKDGLTRYLDNKKSLLWARRAGLYLPGRGTLTKGSKKLFTDKDLEAYRASFLNIPPKDENVNPSGQPMLLRPDAESEFAEALIRLHNHPARQKGFRDALDKEIRSYLNYLTELVKSPEAYQGGETKAMQENLEKIYAAERAYYKGNLGEAVELSELALSDLHERALIGIEGNDYYKDKLEKLKWGDNFNNAPRFLKFEPDVNAVFEGKEPAAKPGEAAKQKSMDEIYAEAAAAPKPTLMQKVFGNEKSFKERRDQLAADLFTPLSTRLRKIGQHFKDEMRKFEFKVRMNETRDTAAVLPFLKAFKRMTPIDRRMLDLALKNSDAAKVETIVKKYGLESEYNRVRAVLDGIHERAGDVGFNVNYIEEYWPRIVLDSGGLLSDLMQTPEWGIIEEEITKIEGELNRPLSELEKAKIANSLIAHPDRLVDKPGAIKLRSVERIDTHLDKYYDFSSSALVQYLHEMNQAIEMRRFFGKSKRDIASEGNKIVDIDGGIGTYVMTALQENKLKPEQQDELIGLLRARFGYMPSGGITQKIKELGYMTSMGSGFSSFITQIGDLTWTYYVAGPIRGTTATVKALFGKSNLKKEDLGLDQIAEEFRTTRGLGKVLERVFSITLLSKMDNVGKESFINGALETYQAQARKENKELANHLKKMFGDEAQSVLDDLKNKTVSDNVKLLLFNRVLDFQPGTLSEMPKVYLTSPRGRLLYMLKTFTIKQLDAFRNESLSLIKAGIQDGDKDKILKGMTNLIYLVALYVLANAGADELKDWLFGRKPKFADKVYDNIWRLFGLSRFIAWETRRAGPVMAFWKLISPPMDIIEAPLSDTWKLFQDDGVDFEVKIKNAETWKIIPFLGKHYYWWYGGGRAGEQKRREKEMTPLERKLERLNTPINVDKIMHDRMKAADKKLKSLGG